MSDELDDLYQEVILDHYQHPRHHEPLARPDVRVEGYNPLCGDKVTVEISCQGERIARIGVYGEGCAISQASASLMTGEVQGRTIEEARHRVAAFRDLMAGRVPEGQDVGDLEALRGVHAFPVRIKCALLGWMALQDALRKRGEPAGAPPPPADPGR